MPKSQRLLYKPGVRGGYDASSRRWRSRSGEIVPKGEFGSPTSAEGVGGYARAINFSPQSTALEKIENTIRGAAKGLEELITFDEQTMRPVDENNKPVQAPNAIPSSIRASYRLIDYYLLSEGDVNQHIEAPIDIVTGSELVIQGKDQWAKRALREIHQDIDMHHVLEQLWYSMAQYGVAYPLEIPGKSKDLVAVLPLPPQYMWVGYQISNSAVAPAGNYQILPSQGNKWEEQAIKDSFMPITYNAFSSGWNEQAMRGWGIFVNPQHLYPVRGRSMDWTRYPTPPISRAFRPMSMRLVFEEYVRATIEGYKNQLWLFLLDYVNNKPPSTKAIAALRAEINGLAGERTGSLVWTGNLRASVLTPKEITGMLSNETWVNFTLDIFRKLGTSVRLATGNTISPGRPDGTTLEVDLSVWLRRIESQRLRVMHWQAGFDERAALSRKDSKLAKLIAEGQIKTDFATSTLERAEVIEKELRPMYQIGLYSPQTMLTSAGRSYEVERDNKLEAEPDMRLFGPPPVFNQMTVNPGTAPSQTTSPTPGRPSEVDTDDLVASRNMLMAQTWEEDKDRTAYFLAVAAAMESLFQGETTAESFVDELKQLNATHLEAIARKAYGEFAPVGEISPVIAAFAAEFVNSFAPGLLDALKVVGDARSMAYRISLYPKEGYKMAYYNGQISAMKQRGARYWKRVLNPEASKSGPCPLCVADSRIFHGIDEPFQVMHPNEACGTQEFYLRYFTSDLMPALSIPVRTLEDEWDKVSPNVADRTARRHRE